MNTTRKFWMVLTGCVLGMALIACSCGTLLPTPTPVPTPIPTQPPLPTATLPPLPTAISEPSPSLAGYWLDTDTNDVHTIEWQDGKYVVTNAASAGDTLTISDQSYENGTLTWTYDVTSTGVKVTFTATSASSDSLYTTWSNSQGNSGSQTLERVSSPVPPQAAATMPPVVNSMAGRWNDPDTTGTVTTIIAVDGGGYAVQSVINPDRGANELTNTSWSNGVLTWTYCIQGGNCITSVTTSVDSTSLYTNWSDDRGYTGQTTFQRLP
jgi:hypothetical protein